MLETTPPILFEKVSVFVLRETANGTELLTFLHPLAGRQIPSGSVEPEEPPEAAAAREVQEETGVGNLKELKQIGRSDEHLLRQAVALCDAVLIDDLGTQIDRIQRGHRVSVETVQNRRLRVSRLVYDFNAEPPCQLPQPTGWAKRDEFAEQISRYFYVANVANDGINKWQQSADGHVFEVEWCVLSPELTLEHRAF